MRIILLTLLLMSCVNSNVKVHNFTYLDEVKVKDPTGKMKFYNCPSEGVVEEFITAYGVVVVMFYCTIEKKTYSSSRKVYETFKPEQLIKVITN